MNVSVGYFSDPDGLEGLAHFLGSLFFFLFSFCGFHDGFLFYFFGFWYWQSICCFMQVRNIH
jgi:hypothetical protein